ncbi:MAG: deacylase [Planctomycetes bacterium]|nr:deacylase [Planctomycetota bacterium]
MPTNQLKSFLDQHNIKYVTISHSPAYTAQQVAARAHVCGRELAKTVVIKVDGRMAMVVLPAPMRIDFELLRQATGAEHLALADESEFAERFPNCEVGAMPPFGNLYGLPVYVAASLTDDTEIVFNAGSHTELIRMYYADFERLVEPRVVHVASHAGA